MFPVEHAWSTVSHAMSCFTLNSGASFFVITATRLAIESAVTNAQHDAHMFSWSCTCPTTFPYPSGGCLHEKFSIEANDDWAAANAASSETLALLDTSAGTSLEIPPNIASSTRRPRGEYVNRVRMKSSRVRSLHRVSPSEYVRERFALCRAFSAIFATYIFSRSNEFAHACAASPPSQYRFPNLSM